MPFNLLILYDLIWILFKIVWCFKLGCQIFITSLRNIAVNIPNTMTLIIWLKKRVYDDIMNVYRDDIVKY